MSEQQQSQPQETILREFSMAINGPVLPGAQRAPRLTIGIYRNKPTISVKTNDPNDNGRDNGRISAEPPIPDFFALKEALRRTIDNKSPHKYVINLKAKRFGAGGQLSQEKMLNVRILIGRGDDGVVYLSLIHWNKDRPMIRFNFAPSVNGREEIEWNDGTGAAMSPADASELYAGAWCTMIDTIVSHLMVTSYRPQEQRQGGGNGGSGYRGNGGGGGGYRGNGGGGNYQGGGQGGGGGGAARNDFGGFDDLP